MAKVTCSYQVYIFNFKIKYSLYYKGARGEFGLWPSDGTAMPNPEALATRVGPFYKLGKTHYMQPANPIYNLYEKYVYI